jgi:hypothetical protein
METRPTIPSEAVAMVDFIMNNLSVEDLRVVTRAIIRSSITAVHSNDLSGLTNTLQIAFSQAELSTILRSAFQGLPAAPERDAPVERRDTYSGQREQAFRTIAEFERVKGQLMSQYAGRYVAFMAGEVVDSDWDRSTLAQRFYQQHGNVPVCIAEVSEEQETIQITTPFFRHR